MSDYGAELPVAAAETVPVVALSSSDYGSTLPLSESSSRSERRPLPPGPTSNSSSLVPPSLLSTSGNSNLVRTSRAKTSNTGAAYDQMRRALAESTPLVRLSKDAKDSKETSARVDSLDLERPPSLPGKIKHGSMRGGAARHGLISLTEEQMQKANDLASSLRMRDAPAAAAVAAPDPSFELLSLEEKLALLRGRAGAGAADLMQRLVLKCCGTSNAKEAMERAIGEEMARLSDQARVSGDRDWNAEFQTLLEMEDGVEKYALLRALYSDFCYAALSYGSIIISERHLPVDQKTIRPVSLGGHAGGEKYLVQSIIFKVKIIGVLVLLFLLISAVSVCCGSRAFSRKLDVWRESSM
jgi:hypothetical protein